MDMRRLRISAAFAAIRWYTGTGVDQTRWTSNGIRAKVRMSSCRVIVTEATCNEILLAYLEAAYTWRQLARAIHRCSSEPTRLARYVNLWAER